MVVTPFGGPAPFTSNRKFRMIRFVIGMFTVFAGVGAVEGTASLATGIIIATVGIMIMLWAINGMAGKGDLNAS